MQSASLLVFVGAVALIGAAVAAPQFPVPQFQVAPQFAAVAPQFRQAAAPVPTIDRSEIVDDAGQFSLTFTTGDGIQVSKQGVLVPTADGTDHVINESGKYRYTSPEGQVVEVEYTADENGFHPKSNSIPVQQGVPQAVFV